MISDPIADLLTRIRNGYLAKKKKVVAPYSDFKERLSQILVREGFLKNVKKEERELILRLQYQNKEPAVQAIRRISKPGRRVYKKAKDLKSTQSGLGVSIVSSPQGLITGKEARRKCLGGEVICEVW